MTEHGRFPFGRPNTERGLRPASSGRASALVVGVYPSAFHVAWSPLKEHDDRPSDERGRPYVASLAVDVEPTVFRGGVDPSPAVLLEQWKQAVGFRESWGSVRPGLNGPSGNGLTDEYLTPLGLEPGEVAMTDVVPWYFVKTGDGSQGAAIERLRAPPAREAKRLLQNFFSAPGDLRVAANYIEVVLDAAATPEEHSALDGLCAIVNAWKLTHPGDPAARSLRFRTQVS